MMSLNEIASVAKKAALALFLSLTTLAAAESSTPEKKGPVLYGDGAGRLWKWEAGEKTFLTPEGQNLVLGGVGEKQLWGWSLAGDRARFFTLELPKKDKKDKKDAKAKDVPPPAPVFDAGVYPVPDRADRVGDRLLLVYEALSGRPRYEVWASGVQIAARAWDDGRSVYALSLGPQEGWMLAGRDKAGAPWLEVSGALIEAPEGWRGRLTVAVWVAEEEKGAPLPRAAGWGAPGNEPPRPIFWGQGWSQPAPDPEAHQTAGVYPVLGMPGKAGVLELAGWQADAGTGVLRPWFWDGKAGQVPGAAADGQPQAMGSGKGGSFLVVRHQSSPWFTQEDGKESVPLEGLDADDRVGAVEAAKTGP